jgi:hypothetical protein
MARKPATKQTPTTKRPPARKAAAPTRKTRPPFSIPPRLFAQVSPHSISGISMFDDAGQVTASTVANFMSDGELLRRTAQALQDAGFDVLQISPYTVNVAAPIATYERAFKTRITPQELPTLKAGAMAGTATFFSGEDTAHFGLLDARGTAFENLVEGVAIEEPRYCFATQAHAPRKAYWHLGVPHDVSLGCNADKAHRAGITGRGVRVAMVDSGQYAHPFFAARGYRVLATTLGPGAANAAADENGHGTAESANIFATAPDVELLPVKMSFANSTGAFNAAVALGAHIITCSWGSDIRSGPLSAANRALAVAVADAVARGIIVIFSSGNGHFGFPGQHPDVISAGGVYLGPDAALQASDYASGFASPIYPGRNAPDVCGLVGMRPRAAYIMLPLQPGCQIDAGLAGGRHPSGDETPADDGWSAISGTSAAAPQLAGVAALIKQACPRLMPAEVRDIMMRTAVDVTAGICNPASSGAAAGPGHDLATGAGLVDAHAAVLVAKVRCLGPVPPDAPLRPVGATLPIEPILPLRLVQPILPIPPIHREPPAQPTQPVAPAPPTRPGSPIVQNHKAGQPMLSAEDVAALEALIIRGKIDSGA